MIAIEKDSLVDHLLPEFLKKHIPARVKSLDNFIDTLQSEEANTVYARGMIREPVGLGSSPTTVGTIGDFFYGAEFWFRAASGRRIIHPETFGSRFGSSFGFADAEKRSKFALWTLITIDARLQDIVHRSPGTHTQLLDAENRRPITEAELVQIRLTAAEHKLAPLLPGKEFTEDN